MSVDEKLTCMIELTYIHCRINQEKRQVPFFAANLLIKSCEMVMKKRSIDMPDGENDPTRSRYAKALEKISVHKWEEDFHLPKKYFRLLQKLPKVGKKITCLRRNLVNTSDNYTVCGGKKSPCSRDGG